MLHMLLELVSSKFLIFALHLSNTGSFPAPLTSAQEQEYLQAHAAGDKLARDKLIEHNLRLVVHVIKNSCNKQKGSVSGFWHANHASGQAFYL